MIFKNENIEVSIDTLSGAVVIKHSTGAKVEILGDSEAGIKILAQGDTKNLNFPRHLYSLAYLIAN
jgi:hypothetical protein